MSERLYHLQLLDEKDKRIDELERRLQGEYQCQKDLRATYQKLVDKLESELSDSQIELRRLREVACEGLESELFKQGQKQAGKILELAKQHAAKDAQLKIARDFIEDVPHDDSCHRWSSIHSTTLGCVCGKDKALKQIGGVK